MGNVRKPRIGIVGLGSIGWRHARELTRAGAQVTALRRPGSGSAAPADAPALHETHDPDAFWGSGLDGVVVANPTSLHIPTLRAAIERTGAVVLVEKPVAVSAAEARAIAQSSWHRVRVGYCLRFHPVVRAVAAALEQGEIGQVVSGRVRFGSSLAEWHPGSDYRQSYAARRDLGGGVLRTLSHEVDLVQHWVGPVEAVGGLLGHVSNLELDVEDVAQLSLRTQTGAMLAVDIDYFTPGYDRSGFLIGTAGRLEYSLNPGKCTVRVVALDGTERSARFAGAEEMYAAQAEDLVRWARGEQSLACAYDEAVHVLEIIEAAERGSEVAIGW